MSTVWVKLFATLRSHRPGLGIGEAFPVEVADGATICGLICQLQLPEDEVRLVFVNAVACERDRVLVEGDELGVFPSVGGGQ